LRNFMFLTIAMKSLEEFSTNHTLLSTASAGCAAPRATLFINGEFKFCSLRLAQVSRFKYWNLNRTDVCTLLKIMYTNYNDTN
jgi:hypothetical protein